MNKKLLKLFELTEEQGISIEYNKLPQGLLGFYMKEPKMKAVISIDKSILNDEDKFLEVFAEEVGHHFTTTGDFVGPFFHYKDRLMLNKTEEKAMRWATEYLIPLNELIEIVKTGICSVNDLIDKLELPREIVMRRLEFLSKKYEVIQITSSKYLVLNSYPNVFVFENI
jgi:hypothetical protein